MTRYRLKTNPEVEAWQFTKTNETSDATGAVSPFMVEATARDLVYPHPMWPDTRLQVVTKSGDPTQPDVLSIVDEGDWIISKDGVLSVVKQEDFEELYETV